MERPVASYKSLKWILHLYPDNLLTLKTKIKRHAELFLNEWFVEICSNPTLRGITWNADLGAIALEPCVVRVEPTELG